MARTPSKRPLDDDSAVSGRESAPAGPSVADASEANSLVDAVSDLISDLLPEMSYDRFEDTYLMPHEEVADESGALGDTVVVYEGRMVFHVSRLSGIYGRELYIPQGKPWDRWNTSQGAIVAKQFLALELKDPAVIGALVSPELMSLYAVGAMIPESFRGPLQKRLVSRIAILARDGHLPGDRFSVWMEIQLKLNAWVDDMEKAPRNRSVELPDLATCLQDARF